MLDLRRGRYAARFAATPADMARALVLRGRCFRSGDDDGDRFDARCRHMLVEECGTGRLACTFRLLPLRDGAGIGDSYAAQHYDLGALAAFAGPLLEMGRFCIDPDLHDADILRVAWGALTRHVDATGARLLFGCSSFPGTDTSRFLDAFAILRDRHLAPACWRPGAKAAEVFPFACAGAVPETPDARRAVKAMPPLLRTYLAMGGWVSDHAVVDRDLGTLHVFTGLEVAAIPPARARALRAVAG